MIVGSVKEIKQYENRVGLIPMFAKEYVDNGHSVIVESNLGLASGYSDQDYLDVGAKVVSSAKEVWDTADMVIKVKEPLEPEYDLMRENQIIYTYLHLAANKRLTEVMLEKKVIGVAYETVVNKDNQLVLLRPMSEIAGRLAIIEASKYLQIHMGGKGILINDATVVIIGVGNVGVSALIQAYGVNARIIALVRNDMKKDILLKQFKGIEVLINTPENLRYALGEADVIVSGVLTAGAKSQKLISREDLNLIEDGTVVVDVAIDQGGSLETSRVTYHDNPTYVENGVIHYCVANMAGATPKSASMALNKATVVYGVKLANKGLDAFVEDEGFKKGINVYKGHLVNKEIARSLGLKYSKLNLED